ncbi:MAG: acid phosphatase [Pseudomonadales bacterium]|jgi:5'-nucleotidase (lipoprotein e(P4) family)|nr:acid phosphatase [Pseudomonadales bacterium]
MLFPRLLRCHPGPVCTLLLALLGSGCTAPQAPANANTNTNMLTVAVAWKQTAAEYEALYYQAFNLAQMQVERAIGEHRQDAPPLAVILDLDDTILDTRAYWASLLAADQDFFDDSRWDAWIPSRQIRASPGALAFLAYCVTNQVEVFYVTSRNQGLETYAYAEAQLRDNGFPHADSNHLTVLTDSSNKQLRQDQIAANYTVVLKIGDNLNDFSRDYYSADAETRKATMRRDQALFGSRYILLPNPTDGHWVRALFGESEPAASDANRRRFRQAAIEGK